MNNTIRKFTYIGMFLGSSFGWYFPKISNFSDNFFNDFFFSIIFGILGTIAGYKLYKYLKRKF